MSFIKDLKKKTNNTNWIKARELFENEILFAVTNIRAGEGEKGPQWNFTCDLRQDTVPDDVEFSGDTTKLVTFSLSQGDSRDDFVKEFKKHLPQGNCFLDLLSTKKGNEFFDIDQLEDDDPAYEEYVPQSESDEEDDEEEEEETRVPVRRNSNSKKTSSSKLSRTKEKEEAAVPVRKSSTRTKVTPVKSSKSSRLTHNRSKNRSVDDDFDPFLDGDDLP